MALTPGTRIGSYEIASHVGSGGMGEVYRARDTQLQRDVAIKVLPALFARDPERLARFAREARTLAALNHPNVAQIFGVVDLPPEGGSYSVGLVMEFVDGEDLSQRIARAGAVPIDEALPIALQLAHALEAAHAQGIIHRDLKPANIKVRGDGQVKVLDFGLAKALDSGSKDPDYGEELANSPTITSPFQMSQLGVILGTAAYMAPEQAKGRPVDKRADIWAFGCVLYEMLTAARAFAGEDATETLAAIVRAEPDWSRLPRDTPANVRTLLRRCLEKDPRERLPDIGAARIELRDARAAGVAPSEPAKGSRRSTFVPWAIAALAVVTAIAAVLYAVAPRPSPPAGVYKSIIVPPAPLIEAPVRRMQLSPDGRRLAFVAPDATGNIVLWMRPLDDMQARPLRGTEHAAAPFWSADSRWIAFQADGKIKKVEAAGGAVTTVGDAFDAPAGSWSRDNVMLMTAAAGTIVRFPASGGARVPVTTLRRETGESIHVTPFFLPDGRHFLYAAGRLGTIAAAIYVGSIDSGEAIRLVEGATPQYANGHLLFMRGSTLMAQPFDPDRLAVSGEAVPLIEDVQINRSTGAGAFSVSQTGELVVQTGGSAGSRLVWFDRGGKPLEPLSDIGTYADVQLSPDGRWALATKVSSEGRSDVWLMDVPRSLPRRVTLDASGGFAAVWKPGGASIAYAVRRPAAVDIVERRLDDSAGGETLLSDNADKYPIGFSPDKRLLLYMRQITPAQGRLWVLSRDDRRSRQLFADQEPQQGGGAISPNGRWIAYVSVLDADDARICVASFPDGSVARAIQFRGAGTPRWREDGKELFFTSGGMLMAVDVDSSGTTFKAGAAHALFQASVPSTSLGTRATFAVSRDGQRFLFNTWDSRNAAVPITLIVNWPQALRR